MFFKEYFFYIQEYCKSYSSIGIVCDNCGEIIDCPCDEVFRDKDYFFKCTECKYNDWISTLPIAKEIKKEMEKHSFILSQNGQNQK